jgi:hypothetical protein
MEGRGGRRGEGDGRGGSEGVREGQWTLEDRDKHLLLYVIRIILHTIFISRPIYTIKIVKTR